MTIFFSLSRGITSSLWQKRWIMTKRARKGQRQSKQWREEKGSEKRDSGSNRRSISIYRYYCITDNQSIKENSFTLLIFVSRSSFGFTVHQFPKRTPHHHYGACYRRHSSGGFLYLSSTTCSFHRINSPFHHLYFPHSGYPSFYLTRFTVDLPLESIFDRPSFLAAESVLWFCSWKLLDWPLWETYADPGRSCGLPLPHLT